MKYKKKLLDRYEMPVYNPNDYPWAFKLWKQQNKNMWFPWKVSLTDDMKCWNQINENGRKVLTQILLMFTTTETGISSSYIDLMLTIGSSTVKMMLISFANMETIHAESYSIILDSVCANKGELQFKFNELLNSKERIEHLFKFDRNNPTPESVIKHCCIFSMCFEGFIFFSSFLAILTFKSPSVSVSLFPGMKQIVTWVAKDETLHTVGMIQLTKVLIEQYVNKKVGFEKIKSEVLVAFEQIQNLQLDFLDSLRELGADEFIDIDGIKNYMKYLVDLRLSQLNFPLLNGIKSLSSDLEHFDKVLRSSDVPSFLERTPTEYSQEFEGWDSIF